MVVPLKVPLQLLLAVALSLQSVILCPSQGLESLSGWLGGWWSLGSLVVGFRGLGRVLGFGV